MPDSLSIFIIITVLVLLNSLFVAAEFAIVVAPRGIIEHLAEQGVRKARQVHTILQDIRLQDRYIATAQIGITVASLGLGMYGEHVVADLLRPWLEGWTENPWLTTHMLASVLSIGCLTYLHIVLGEMIPKALALQHAERTVLLVTPVIVILEKALSPLVSVSNGTSNALLGMFGIRRQQQETERYHTTDELRLIIEESHQGGLLRGEAGSLLRELFEYGNLNAGQVMVPRTQIAALASSADPEKLRTLVKTSPHTRYPVHTGSLDHIVGSLHIKDALRHLVENRPVTKHETRYLPHVPTSAPLDEVLSAMRRHRAQMVIVTDQYGTTTGLVTIEDLFATLG